MTIQRLLWMAAVLGIAALTVTVHGIVPASHLEWFNAPLASWHWRAAIRALAVIGGLFLIRAGVRRLQHPVGRRLTDGRAAGVIYVVLGAAHVLNSILISATYNEQRAGSLILPALIGNIVLGSLCYLVARLDMRRDSPRPAAE